MSQEGSNTNQTRDSALASQTRRDTMEQSGDQEAGLEHVAWSALITCVSQVFGKITVVSQWSGWTRIQIAQGRPRDLHIHYSHCLHCQRCDAKCGRREVVHARANVGSCLLTEHWYVPAQDQSSCRWHTVYRRRCTHEHRHIYHLVKTIVSTSRATLRDDAPFRRHVSKL